MLIGTMELMLPKWVSMYRGLIKRGFDCCVALVIMLLFVPLFLVCMMVLGIVNRDINIFFLQARPGKNGKIFYVVKFKTMTDERGTNGELLPDEKRLTKIGKFIRSTSLDELPQLINVLKGDMSLIGPRPLLPQYLPLYTKEQIRRHDVRPGITGWAQVNGRNDISWGKKFELDVWYVDHLSFWLDMKIIFLTIWKVLKRDGVSKEGMATTEPFNGYN
jgi:hypothetical protein